MSTAEHVTLNRPDHVPEHLVWNHSIRDYGLATQDPYRELAELFHGGPEIRWSPAMQMDRPGWIITRHALIDEIYQNTDNFSNSATSDLTDMLGVDWLLNPVGIDPPHHKTYRALLQPWFQPSAVNRMDETMRMGCRALIDRFAARGHCEFISEFALQFPSQVFLNLMGLPIGMLDQFLEWEGLVMRADDPADRLGAVHAIVDYLTEAMEEKKRNPQGDDLGTFIATMTIEGRPITQGEMMGMALLMYVAGLDTVASSMSWYFRHLAQAPELQDRLRDEPDCIPRAMEELLRAYSPNTIMRMVTRDIEFHGVKMRRGDVVGLANWLAGRDDRVYQDPHRVDFDRAQRHLTFGTGPHNCLGSHLARREIRILFEEWFPRIGNFRIAEGEDIDFDPAAVWSVTRLPLTWDA